MTVRRWAQALAWSAAVVGGWLGALMLPALLGLCAFALPLGWLDDPDATYLWLREGIGGAHVLKGVLAAVHVLVFWHAAHRAGFITAYLLGRARRAAALLGAAAYAGALLGSLWAIRCVWAL